MLARKFLGYPCTLSLNKSSPPIHGGIKIKRLAPRAEEVVILRNRHMTIAHSAIFVYAISANTVQERGIGMASSGVLQVYC